MTFNEYPSSNPEANEEQRPAPVDNNISDHKESEAPSPAPSDVPNAPAEEETPWSEDAPVNQYEAPAEEAPAVESAQTAPFAPTYEAKNNKPFRNRKKEYRLSGIGIALLLVLCLSVSVFSGVAFGFFLNNREMPVGTDMTTGRFLPPDNRPSETTAPLIGSTETAPPVDGFSDTPIAATEFSEVAKKAWRSVVIIRVTDEQSAGAGAGVIYKADGYIVTNYHVVGKDTKTISVELFDGSVYDGRFIYGDELSDISVIKIDKSDCDPVTFGNSDAMTIASPVFAIGNPLGKGLRITNGIIAAPESEVTVDNITMTLMNTNAAINSGNSGGGLFNMNGELVGIVNAKIGGTSVEGFGFAIPSSTVLHCINDLNDKGYITGRARLGVTVTTRNFRDSASWFFARTYSLVQISEIQAGGSADGSGLQVGDILYEVDGDEISSFEVLQRILTRNKVGDTVKLTVLRPSVPLKDDGSNLQDFLKSAEEVDLTITFTEFKPET